MTQAILAAATPAATPAAKAEKTAYTAAQTIELVTLYAAGKGMTIEALAEKFGKNAKSIISKLAREKVYVKPEGYQTKTGQPVTKKDDTADAIGAMLQLNENDTSSLTKANKPALLKISTALAHSVPLEILTPENEKSRDSIADSIGHCFKMNESERLSLRRVPVHTLKVMRDSLVAYCVLQDTNDFIEQVNQEESVA